MKTIDCSDKVHEGLIRVAAPNKSIALIECIDCDKELDEIYMFDVQTAEMVCTNCGSTRQQIRDMKKEKRKKDYLNTEITEPSLKPGPRGRPRKKKITEEDV